MIAFRSGGCCKQRSTSTNDINESPAGPEGEHVQEAEKIDDVHKTIYWTHSDFDNDSHIRAWEILPDYKQTNAQDLFDSTAMQVRCF